MTFMVRAYKQTDFEAVLKIDPEFGFLDIPRFVIRVVLGPEGGGYIAYRREGFDVFVRRMFVEGKHRFQGIGQSLLDSIDKYERMYFILHEKNSHFGWFLKRGFVGCSVRFNYFPDGRDGFVFERVNP